MPKCRKCSGEFPRKIWLDGKQRNLQNRVFCLSCSPFGSHNTKDLVAAQSNIAGQCSQCGRKVSHSKKLTGGRCYVCIQKAREKLTQDKLYAIVGEACLVCGYQKGRKMLDFHHVDSKHKRFSLNVRNVSNLSWSKVLEEVKKCIVVCCRCHREIEYGLISSNDVIAIYEKAWKTANGPKSSSPLVPACRE
jgi:hypothetical protein